LAVAEWRVRRRPKPVDALLSELLLLHPAGYVGVTAWDGAVALADLIVAGGALLSGSTARQRKKQTYR
jgi:hypothetical protein